MSTPMRRSPSLPRALVLLPLLAACAGGAGAPDATLEDDTGQVPTPLCVAGTPVAIPDGCDACHGMPPLEGRHPRDARCGRCHGFTVDADLAFVNPDLHRNGTVEAAVGCSSCHGWNLGVSPPPDLDGGCTPGAGGVGAHFAMRQGALPAHQVGCVNCHPVPLDRAAAGHDDGKVDVVFAALARADGAQPAWDGTACSGTYCHGATLAGGTLTAPRWQDTSHAPSRCGACHALECPKGKKGSDCSACHPASLKADGTILPEGKHVNGVIDVAAAAGGAP